MKKSILLFVMMLVASSVNAQSADLNKLRTMALNRLKTDLVAPSKFILTDGLGNKISTSQIKVKYVRESYEMDSIYSAHFDTDGKEKLMLTTDELKGNLQRGLISIDEDESKKYVVDSMIVRKLIYPAHYIVYIKGEGMNHMGGYEKIYETFLFTAHYAPIEDVDVKERVIKTSTVGKNYLQNLKKEVEKEKRAYPTKEFEFQKICNVAEQMPSFVGGQQALMDYISNNIHYPIVAKENGVEGRVVVSFVVERDGSLSDLNVIRSVDPSLDKEAVRLVKSMPKWNAGKKNGICVRVKYNVPITFRLY